MGLLGYTKKDYKINSANFNDKLMEIMQLAAINKVGNGIGTVINAVMYNISQDAEFPKDANGKVLKEIDARIDKTLGKMKDDIQQRSPARLAAHATVLLSAVTDSRRFGKERFSAKELEAEEVVVECKALIRDSLLEKGEKKEAQAKLEAKGNKLPDGHAELELIAQEWEDLEKDLEAIDGQIDVYRKRHNANIEIINVRKLGAAYTKLPEKITTVQEFDRESEMILMKAAEEAGYTDGISEKSKEVKSALAGERGESSSGQSAFFAKRAATQAAQLSDNVDSASVENKSAGFSSNNPFAGKMRKE